jgi:Sodium:neurotransmitter symporter family.
MCLLIFQGNLLSQHRSEGVAELKVSTCKTPQSRQAVIFLIFLIFLIFKAVKSPNLIHILLFTAGIGYGQMFATLMVSIYYCSLMALTVFYFVQSFAAELQWATCLEEWGHMCYDSKNTENISLTDENFTDLRSSSELYF